MGDYGFKVTKETKDISSTIPEDFVFNSKLDGNIKIVQEGARTLTINANSSAVDIVSHPFGFAPAIMLFGEYPQGSGKWFFGIEPRTAYESYVTDFNLYTKIYNYTGQQVTIKYYYFMFAETAEY